MIFLIYTCARFQGKFEKKRITVITMCTALEPYWNMLF